MDMGKMSRSILQIQLKSESSLCRKVRKFIMAAPEQDSKFIELKPFTDEMIVSMGPQHPSTHGRVKA